MKSNYDITVEMKIQNFGYLTVSRNLRTPNSKYGRFGSFLGLLVLFSLSLWEICKLECILELTADTKSNEKLNCENLIIYRNSRTPIDRYDRLDGFLGISGIPLRYMKMGRFDKQFFPSCRAVLVKNCFYKCVPFHV